MTNNRLLIAALWMGTAGMCFASPDRLTVAVVDYTDLPSGVIQPAVQLARRVFIRAGMDAIWVICHEPGECQQPLPEPGHYVAMLVMPRIKLPLAETVAGDPAGVALTGFAAVGQPRAWAFYQSVEKLARLLDRPVAQVLGCVLVHEVAHVLGLGHQNSGIMQAMLSPREIDAAAMGLVFDGAEVKQLRAGASRLAERDSVAAARR